MKTIIAPKESSKFMRFLYAVALMKYWNPRWMEDYTVALFGKVYMPQRFIGTPQGERILRHEMVHLQDEKRWGPLFHLSYLFLPIGPSFRAYWEFRAYKESMRAYYEAFGDIPDELIEHYAKYFTGPSYLFMFPFPKTIRKLLNKARREIINDT